MSRSTRRQRFMRDRIAVRWAESSKRLFEAGHGRSRSALSMRQKSYVFGTPTMVFNDELFLGSDRIDMLIERIDSDIEGEGVRTMDPDGRRDGKAEHPAVG
jgi:hypothetical protein